jgi:SAM-dependent methyltransferase
MSENAETLRLSDAEIVAQAKRRLGGNFALAGRVLRQAFTEQRLRLARRISFRSDANSAALDAYCAMSGREFEGINARQQWANWRTVPRNLAGNLELRPLRVIDLCCGVGHSTEVLAHYVAPGSHLLGLEFNPRFVEIARGRRLFHADGSPARAEFRAQSILETFRDAAGAEIPAGSVDLVNCCGALGNHFRADRTRVVAAEVDRVLRPGGLALLDAGPDGTRPEELRAIFAERGFLALRESRSCAVDRFRQLALRKPA